MFRFLTLFISSISLLFIGLSTDTPTFNSGQNQGIENSVISNFNNIKKSSGYNGQCIVSVKNYGGSTLYYQDSINLIGLESSNNITLNDLEIVCSALVSHYWVLSDYYITTTGDDFRATLRTPSNNVDILYSGVFSSYTNGAYFFDFRLSPSSSAYTFNFKVNGVTTLLKTWSSVQANSFIRGYLSYDYIINLISLNSLAYAYYNNNYKYSNIASSNIYGSNSYTAVLVAPNDLFLYPFKLYISTSGLNGIYEYVGEYILDSSVSASVVSFQVLKNKVLQSKPSLSTYVINTGLSNIVNSSTDYSFLYIYNPVSSETNVVDIWGLCLNVVTLPFTFISQSFNVTMFEGTPFAFNLSYFLMTLIGVLIVILIIKIILGAIK